MKFLTVGIKQGSQFLRLEEEAKKLGHEIVGCKSSDLVIKSGEGIFEASVNRTNLNTFDLIYFCAGIEQKNRLEWFVVADYLNRIAKTRIVNQIVAGGKNYFPNQTWFYLKQFENKILEPLSFTLYDPNNLDEIASEVGFPMIVKISETHQGKGIFLANSREEVLKIFEENPEKAVVLRKFIPNDGDIRIFVVGGKAIGAMSRIPKEGEFRSNISQGGRGEPFNLEANPDIKNLAEEAAKVSEIEIAGVDILIDKDSKKAYVLEVNVGPQFRGLEQVTGINVASEIIKYFS